ncbi:TetR/AcrR family transcriptional regulator [Oceanicoccus sp.]|uniref:TetR/AcrR family transcriptional regulator n=1 Tax=Oceanicoccus sp. TaxID=2691044 RepID=UPI00263A27FD|nr:TetR/AcrR family transcriptional regulator [Oceanicoccus sp.]
MSASKVDGRQQRSERSRQQIIDAMIQLMNKGIYIPTAQQVANEADISIRTVFRLFSEMDKLFLEIDEVLRPSYESYFDAQDTSGSLEDRIMRAVEARVSCYLEIRALFVATRSLLWRSEILTETYQNNQKRLRQNLINMLPELKAVKAETLETVDAVTSFEFLERLQLNQGRCEKACRRLVYNLVLDLLTP